VIPEGNRWRRRGSRNPSSYTTNYIGKHEKEGVENPHFYLRILRSEN